METLFADPINVTFALIALNVAISLPGFWALRREQHRDSFLFIPYRTAKGENWLGLLLSHFAHGDVGHLLLNMLALFLFGPRVESALGPLAFLLVYVVSGLGGTLVVFLFRRKNRRYSALGASGSIAGVVFALVVIAPTASMFVPFVPISVPAPVFALIYVVFSSVMMQRGDHVAHEAHLGGALSGLVAAGLLFEEGFAPLVRAVTRLVS